MAQNRKVVRVTWDDAGVQNRWQSIDAAMTDGDPIRTVTVGILLSSNRKRIIVANSINMHENVSDVTTIPRGMVRQVDVMVVVPKRKATPKDNPETQA